MKRAAATLLLTSSLLGACGGSPDIAGVDDDPPLETAQEKLDAALRCTPYTHPDKPAVLLIHGTLAKAEEQWELTYLPMLSQLGYDVCLLTYPDRGIGDLQISAEYVVNAIQRMHADSGRKIAMVGHSQGGTMPRWALKWWRSAREGVDDYVMLSAPNHGFPLPELFTAISALNLPLGVFPAAFYQLDPDANFVQALNAGDETPGAISYTSIYTVFDELIQPVRPLATAALDRGQSNPQVANLLLQDLCPGHLADHFTMGISDLLTFRLVVDAISHDGPADFERAGGAELCGALPIIPAQIVPQISVEALIAIVRAELTNPLPSSLHLTDAEPPLKTYVR